MPQASDCQRAKWGIIESKAEAYLYFHGWTLVEGWEWWHPIYSTTMRLVPRTDREAIAFLVDEWDYGGIVREYTTPHGRVDFHTDPRSYWEIVDELRSIEQTLSGGTGQGAA